MYGKGISYIGEVLDYGILLGAVGKSGAWITYKDVMRCQGRDNAKLFLEQNPDICQEIADYIKEHAAELTMARGAKPKKSVGISSSEEVSLTAQVED